MLFEASNQPPTLVLRDSLPEVEESGQLRLPEPVSGRIRAWLQPFWGTAVRNVQIAPTPRQEKGSNNCLVSVLLAIILRVQGQAINYPPRLLNNFRTWLFLVQIFATLTPPCDTRLAAKGLRLLASTKLSAEVEPVTPATRSLELTDVAAEGNDTMEEVLRAPLLSSQGAAYEEQWDSLEDWAHAFWLSPGESSQPSRGVSALDQDIERLVPEATPPPQWHRTKKRSTGPLKPSRLRTFWND